MEESGPGTSGQYKKGDRVVAVPWPSRSKGQGTWQQYVAVPEKDLVSCMSPVVMPPSLEFCSDMTMAICFPLPQLLHFSLRCLIMCCIHLQVRVPEGVDSKAAAQFLVNPVTGVQYVNIPLECQVFKNLSHAV